jgi:putative sigma-54 modulation protein
MQINISGHHVDVTSALRTYVSNKMKRIERHFDHMINIHVVLGVEKERQRAEATVQVSGARLFADAEHDDMYAAIDVLCDKLDRQIKKHKERLMDHHRSDGGLKNQEINR